MLDLLRDPYNLDFRPRADAVELIDQGKIVECDINGERVDITAGYNGEAPDIGAYEYGDENYNIPGYQYPQASAPYPADGRTDALNDSDLMWRGGLNAVSYKVYLGTSANSLVLKATQANNIFTPDAWINDQTYYWRVDSVKADGSVVTGDVWAFTINDHAPDVVSSQKDVMVDGSATVKLAASDPDGGSLSYTIKTQPSHGTLTGSGATYVYTPDAGYEGADSFVYTVNNGTADSTWAMVVLNVTYNPASVPAGIRATEYYLTTGDFTGTEATLTLDQQLADDYFILVRGSRDGDGLSMPDADSVRVTGVPWAVGDMAGSGNGKSITLSRAAVSQDWEGVVTVVECTNPDSLGGFHLVDIVST
jgi:hypothetical protein